jgi:hypothetical protein
MMSVVSRQELAREVSRRYARATRPEKSRILDEFVWQAFAAAQGFTAGRETPAVRSE